jgi:hypothetical protein
VAVYLALGVFLFGVLALSRIFGPALLHRDREAADPGAAPDAGREPGSS